MGALRLLHTGAIGYVNLVTDARIFVDNRSVNCRIGADADIGNALRGVAFDIAGRLVKIGTHYNRVGDLATGAYHRADSNHRTLDLGVANIGAFANDSSLDAAIFQTRTG